MDGVLPHDGVPARHDRHRRPSRLVWHLGPGAENLRDEVLATGATFVQSTDDPQVDLVRVQRLAAEVAVERALDPDRPRNLTRSVVLAAAARPGRIWPGSTSTPAG